MGKDRSKDENATAENKENKDHSRDQDTRDVSLAKTIAEAADPSYHRCVSKADGGDMCAV